nr:unnamed protein product [Digitaria exilis]
MRDISGEHEPGWREVPVEDPVVVEDFAKFDILMKLKRGSKEEKIKAEVHKNLEGAFMLNHHQPAEHDESTSTQ